ncbi:MAG: membrane protein insertase YidC [Bacteroidales bacterium]|nr:membrane protein insertase YidC [Bacteroidales bacterium]
MDKNTITGLVLIGLLLIGFSWFSQPSKEQREAMQHYNDSIAAIHQEESALKLKQQEALSQEVKSVKVDSTSIFYSASKGEEQIITLENEVMKVMISTLGGRITSAQLKEYNDQEGKSLILFDKQDSQLNFNFYNVDEIIQTQNYFFTPVLKEDNKVTMRLVADEKSYIDFIYELKPQTYLVDFNIQAQGMQDKLAATDYVDINWKEHARQHEQGGSFEQRLSRLTYKLQNSKTKDLSPAKNDDKEVEEKINWIAFKNRFFSSVFIADQGFDNSKLDSKVEPEGSDHVKDYSAEMKTFFDPTGAKPTTMHFYLGPNHYKTLKALDNDRAKVDQWDLDRLVYLGWPILRWINKWFTINLFDWLSNWGLSMGVVLLFMTIIVKLVVFPATWKTFMSSTKMRVLKPEIDKINAKYPNEDDAMKKQQEVMALYSQYGVSPMGGCLPMLLQFPILMALFMFVPSAIELRQESFLWATDLSTYDSFINLPFNIPFLGSHISLFCLLMTVTNILNTKFTMAQQNTGAQPQMAAMKWMMYLMPVMFLFILNSFPSGLTYYYFLSTLISIITTLVLKKVVNEDKVLAELEAKKSTEKKTSGFAARLAAMQEQQEELLKQQQKGKKK